VKGVFLSFIANFKHFHQPEKKDDKTLIKEILKGKEDSFTILIQRYEQQVSKVSRRFFKTKEDQVDFQQEVYIRVYEKLQSFRFESPFSIWLYKITYNLALNKIKSLKRNKTDLFVEEWSLYNNPNHQLTYEQSLVKNVEKKEMVDHLLSNLSDLPNNQRIALELFYFDELSLKDIAGVMDFNLNTVKSHIHRAKESLRKKMKNHHGDFLDE
jgi:RNA polymerase sigma-70 factor, ECF subfamily